MGGVVSTVASGLGSLASGVIGTVTSIGKSVIGGLVGAAVEWVSEKIFGISDTPSYNPQSASIDQTKIVNQMISECVDSYGEEAKKLENFAKNMLEEYLNNIIMVLTPLKEKDVIPFHIIKSLEYETKVLKESINNVYMISIENTFSLNNNNLLNILELDPGKEKQKKLQTLAISTLEESNAIFKEKISKFFLKQQQHILKELIELKKQRENLKDSVEEEFEKIRNKKEESQDALNKSISELKNIIAVLNQL